VTDNRSALNIPISVFLDTSVIIAAAISNRGTSRALLNLISAGGCVGFVSVYVLEEMQRNLTRKTPHIVSTIDNLMSQAGLSLVSPTTFHITQAEQHVELKDAPVVAAALTARVDALVTLDKKHLLNREHEIREALGIAVVDPGAILRRVIEA
jgi:putative PIN family toxin of toxin-antitoxin system